MPAAFQNLNVRRHAKPSTAYAEAAVEVSAELEKLAAVGVANCREATWVDAEQMTRFALALKELREQFAPASVR